MNFTTRLFHVARSVVPTFEAGKLVLPTALPVQLSCPIALSKHLPVPLPASLQLPALPSLSLPSLSLPAPEEVVEPLLVRLEAAGDAIADYELPPLVVLELALLITCVGLATVLLVLSINRDLAEW